MAETSKRAAVVKRKQMLILGGVGAAVALLSIGVSVWLQPAPKVPTGAAAIPKTRQLQLGGSSSDKEAWRAQSQAEFDRFRKQLMDLQKAETDRQARETAEKKRAEEEEKRGALERTREPMGSPVAPPEPPAGTPRTGMFSMGGVTGEKGSGGPIKAPPMAGAAGHSQEAAATGGIKVVNFDDEGESEAEDSSSFKGDAINSAKRMGKSTQAQRGNSAAKTAGRDAQEDEGPAKTYLPAGTFIRAVLLNGLDAPTGGQAQQNPHPILLRLVDNAQLPNNFKANLKDCVITANGHGDLSAERAYIRADRLSCIDEEGKAVDVKIAGYVSGEDGKTGIRGRLVTKTGQVLANALYSGIMSSAGEVFKGQGVNSTTNAFGSTQNNVSDPFKVAVGGGVGKAFDELSKYYTRLADKLYPVIEVDGGRVVDVVLSQGVQIARK